MAEKKTIELEVKDNLQPTIQNLRELKKQLKETAAGSKDFDKISAQIRDMDDAISDAKATNDDFLGQLENASGPLGMLGKSIRGAERTFSSFNGALKASVIGLIVSLIGGLVAAFQDNEVAMKKLQPLLDGMQKVFQGIFRAVEPLFNTLVDLAISALPTVSKAFGVVYSSVTAVFQSLGMLGSAIKKLVSGDFSGAWKDAKSSVNDFSSNYDASIKRFNEGTKEMSKTEKEESEKRAEARKAADEKRKEQQEKAKQDAIAKKKEEADALRKIEEDRIAAEMASAQEVMDKERSLREGQETPLQKEEREYQEWLVKYQANNLNTELLTQQHLDNVSNITKTASDKEIADAKAKEDKITADKKAAEEARRNINNIAIQSAQGLVGILAGLGEKNKGIQKAALIANSALSIAEIINNTNVGSSKEVATKGIFGLSTSAVLYAKMAISIGSVIAATAKGLGALGGGASGSAPSGGGGATGGGGGTAPAAPAFNVVGASATNQLAQTIGNQQQQPIKAYVVSNDVTTAQSLDRNIIQSASIG